MGRACSAHGGIGNAYKILVGKREGSRHSEYLGADGGNIKMHLRKPGLEVVNWICVARDRDRCHSVVNTLY
jgi:hypothetical protein